MKIKKVFLYILSLCCAFLVFADGENYNGQDVSGLDFSGTSHVDSSWIGCIAIGTIFSNSLDCTDYSGSNFTGANLTDANFTGGNFTNANFTNANLFRNSNSHTFFYRAILTNADFTNAIINGCNFKDAIGFTTEQLASTWSFKNKDLSDISPVVDISSLDLTDFNITGTNLSDTNLKAEQLYSTANYKNKNLRNVGFYTGDYSGWNFVGQNLQNTHWKKSIITNADASGADLRGAYFPLDDYTGEFYYKNTIMSDGVIKNFSMKSASDSLVIREYVPEYSEYGGDYQISAKISEDDAIVTGGAQLSLEQGAKLEITNGKTLTVASDGKLKIQTDVNFSTTLLIDSLAGLNIDTGGELTVDIVGEFNLSDYKTFTLLEWNADSKIVGLSDFVKDETIFFTLNGENYIGEWEYLIENNQFIITIQVPEPAAYAAIFGIFAMILAYKKRIF